MKAQILHKRNWIKQLIVSVGVALVLMLADYWIQNITYPLFDDVDLLTWVDKIVGSKKNYFNEDDVTYINIGKDKMLVPAVDEWGDTIGNTVISNREALLSFLNVAEKSDYKYILLDVRFEQGFDTPYDSALFDCIRRMPNLVIATHRKAKDYTIADSTLLPKAANADYRSTLHTGFTRYEFLQDGSRSVALRMLHDIDRRDIEKRWYGYTTDDGQLCYNMKYIPLPKYLFKSEAEVLQENTIGEEVRYPYLGSYILNQRYFTEEEIVENKLDNKIVVVGDFDNDVHTTYVGEIPGSILLLAAYKYLRAGLHEVNKLYLLFLFVLFAITTYVMLTIRHIANIFVENSLWHYILSLLGIGALFFVIKVLLYVSCSISMIMVVPTLFYHLLGNLSTYKKIFDKLFHKRRAIS